MSKNLVTVLVPVIFYRKKPSTDLDPWLTSGCLYMLGSKERNWGEKGKLKTIKCFTSGSRNNQYSALIKACLLYAGLTIAHICFENTEEVEYSTSYLLSV